MSLSSFQPSIIVAPKPHRGSGIKWLNYPGYARFDVTSGSMNKINGLKLSEISPMHLRIPLEYPKEESIIFENFWQYSKVYPQLGHLENGMVTSEWYEWRMRGFQSPKGIRTPPEVKKLKEKYRKGQIETWKPAFSFYQGKEYDYITARKELYVPIYYRLLIESPVFAALKGEFEASGKILLMDVDALPMEVAPGGVEINRENLKWLINNPEYPLAHGYIIGGALLGITPEEYCG